MSIFEKYANYLTVLSADDAEEKDVYKKLFEKKYSQFQLTLLRI